MQNMKKKERRLSLKETSQMHARKCKCVRDSLASREVKGKQCFSHWTLQGNEHEKCRREQALVPTGEVEGQGHCWRGKLRQPGETQHPLPR